MPYERLRRKKDRVDSQFESDVEIFFANQHRVRSIYWLLVSTAALATMALVASLLTYTQIKAQLQERSRTGDAIIETSGQTRQLTAENTRLLNTIEDCLNPRGVCAQRNQDGQKNVGTAITYCTKNLPTGATRDIVSECIIRELTREIDR